MNTHLHYIQTKKKHQKTKKQTIKHTKTHTHTRTNTPAKDTKYEVDDEEGADDDERDEVHPWPWVAHGVVDLGGVVVYSEVQYNAIECNKI